MSASMDSVGLLAESNTAQEFTIASTFSLRGILGGVLVPLAADNIVSSDTIQFSEKLHRGSALSGADTDGVSR